MRRIPLPPPPRSTPVAVAEDAAAPLQRTAPPIDRGLKSRRGKIEEGRKRAILYLQKNGPQTRSRLCRECGIATGSMTMAFDDPRFTTIDGLTHLSPAAAAPAFVESLNINKKVINDVREKVYMELSLHDGPRTFDQLHRELKVREALIHEALAHKWFRKTSLGYSIAKVND